MLLNKSVSSRTSSVGIVILRALFVVILVVVLRRIEVGKLDDGSGYGLGEPFGLIQALFAFLSYLFC